MKYQSITYRDLQQKVQETRRWVGQSNPSEAEKVLQQTIKIYEESLSKNPKVKIERPILRDGVAYFVSIFGNVQRQKEGTTRFAKVLSDDEVKIGDFIQTGTSGKAAIMLYDGAFVKLESDTLVQITKTENVLGFFIVRGKVDANTNAHSSKCRLSSELWKTEIFSGSVVSWNHDDLNQKSIIRTYQGRLKDLDDPSRVLKRRQVVELNGENNNWKPSRMPGKPTLLNPGNHKRFGFSQAKKGVIPTMGFATRTH